MHGIVAESGAHHVPLEREWEDIEGLQSFWRDVGERELFRPLPPSHIVLEWVGRGSFRPGVPCRLWRLTVADRDGPLMKVEGCSPRQEEHFPAMCQAELGLIPSSQTLTIYFHHYSGSSRSSR